MSEDERAANVDGDHGGRDAGDERIGGTRGDGGGDPISSDDGGGDGQGDRAAGTLNYQIPANQPIHWVSVWKARDTMEANLAVATLQERGIHARVDMENTADLGLYYVGIANSKVQVPAADAEAARRLLLAIDRQRARRQEAASLKCPRCSTPDPKRVMHPLRWAAWGVLAAFVVLVALEERVAEFVPVGWLLLLLPLGLLMLAWGVTPRWRCKSCGHRWYAPEPEEVDEDEDEDNDNDNDNDREPAVDDDDDDDNRGPARDQTNAEMR